MKLSSLGYLIKEGFKNIRTNRMMSLASIVVLASCLIITGAASLISVNVSTLISKIGDDNELTVYLDLELNNIDSIKLGAELKKIKNVERCTYYPKDEAIKEYKENLGDVYESMQGDGNPFPNAYKVQIDDLSKYKETVSQIKKIDGVDSVSDRSGIASALTKLNYFVTIVGFWLVLILAVVTMFIISNTIKMTMYSRRYEISIMKSVGATNRFVRIPFVVEAMTIGLLSGVLASAVLLLIYDPIKQFGAGIVRMIGTSTIPESQIWLPLVVTMSCVGMLIGLVGGSVSITKYLKKEGGGILGW